MPSAALSPSHAADSLENRYYAYLRGRGYSTTAALLDVLRVYVPLFEGHSQVADLGCGHGEFLALLRDQGHEVSGVDVDPGMVDACRAQGFSVALGDAAPWLEARPASLDGVFSSNVIEHLPAATVTEWIGAAAQALRPGGRIVLATPNPESAIVQLYEFWRDPTHVRLYSRQLLEFMLVDAGFTDVASHENPAAAWEGAAEAFAGLDDPLPGLPSIAAPAALEMRPQAPPPGSPWTQRLSWRIASFVYAKFGAPFVEPLRLDLERQLAALQQQAAALQREREVMQSVHTRMVQIANANRFLYPSREIYVTGVKPAAGAA